VGALLTRTKPPPTQRGSERVAQVVEHVTFNHGVEGSSPSALTMKTFVQPGHIGNTRSDGTDN
jgi:hypothetical protein